MDKSLNLSKIKTSPVTTKELERLGISRNKIQELVADDKLLRIGRGVYQLSSLDLDDESLYRAATKRIKEPSAICLVSALAHYNLIDEIPKKTWLMVNANGRSYQKDIRLFRSRNPNWKIGIQKEQGYKITTLERTIVDAITYKHILGNLGIEALKRALKDKQTTASKIMDIAVKLKAVDRLLPYLQALS